nr:hypothetical protein [Tanacetum cinerariifolium]
MDDSTCQIIDEDQSVVQEVHTQETPIHDVHDVIVSDEHDLSYASPYVDSESNNESRRPTPNGRKYWFLDVPVEEKPNEGNVFDNFDKAYNMYLEYSQKARFSIRKSTTKRKNGNITHKYILCSKAGKPRKTIVKDTLVQDDQKEVDHNEGAKKVKKIATPALLHPLVEENNLDNLKARRKLDFSEKVFIHRASLSNIGPTKARHLRVVFKGRQNKVRGKAIDWKNFRRSLNKYIEMFEIRDRWIPGYFKDLPMCYLMKTTSRSESSNAFFRIHYHASNMLLLMNWMEALRVHVIILDVMDTFVAIYGPCIEEADQLASDIHTTIEYCVNRLRNDTEKLTKFLAKAFLHPNEVVVKVPKGIWNKGCGTGGARFIGPSEKAKNKAKTKQQGRSCSICFETRHNMRTCKRNKSKGKEIMTEESEDEKQADDNDTSDHATSDTNMSSSIDTQGIRNKRCGYTGPHEKATGKAK